MNLSTWVISLGAGAVALPVHAQAPGSQPEGLAEVVVTARRVEESLQSAPVSITALSAAELEERGFTALSDVAQAAPNLWFSDVSGAQVFIRGVGQGDPLPTADPGVAIYVDGVYVSRQTGVPSSLTDIQRLEVLRGPQGTLFGKNSLGGAINIVTNEPAEEFTGLVRGQVGSRDRAQLDARISGPLSDTLAGSLAAGLVRQDGYYRNLATGEDFNDTDRTNARFKLRWSPAENLSLTLSGDYEEHDENGIAATNTQIVSGTTPSFFAGFIPLLDLAPAMTSTQYVGLYNASVGCTPATANSSPNCFGTHYQQRGFATQETEITPERGEHWGTSLVASWELGDTTLKSITAYREFDATTEAGADGTPLPIAEIGALDRQNQFSEELQATGTAFSERLNWTGGLYYLREHVQNDTRVRFLRTVPAVFPLAGLDDGTGDPVSDPSGPIIAPTQVFFTALNLDTVRRQRTESVAAYGQGGLQLTDALSATLGLRYNRDSKEMRFEQVDLTGPPPGIPGVMNASSPELKESWNSFTPRVGLEYQLSPERMLYVSWARGYKSGGFNARPTTNPPRFTTYDPETLNTVELGFKSEWLDRRLRFNGDLFHSKYKDIQLGTFLFVDGQYVTEVANSGDGTTKGAEFELAFLPHPRVFLSAGLGFLDFEYDRVNDVAGPGTDSPPGDRLPNAPEYMWDLSARFTLTQSAAGETQLRLDYRRQDDVAFDVFNRHVQPAYGLLNGRLGFKSASGRWSVFLAGSNLTDERYANLISNFDLFGLPETTFYAAPRTWFAGAEYEF